MPLTMEELTAIYSTDTPANRQARGAQRPRGMAQSEALAINLTFPIQKPQPGLVPKGYRSGARGTARSEAAVLGEVQAHTNAARNLAAQGQPRAARSALNTAAGTVRAHRGKTLTPSGNAAATVEVNRAAKDVSSSLAGLGDVDPGFLTAYRSPAQATYAPVAARSSYDAPPGGQTQDWTAPGQIPTAIQSQIPAWTNPWSAYQWFGGAEIQGNPYQVTSMASRPQGPGSYLPPVGTMRSGFPIPGTAAEKF